MTFSNDVRDRTPFTGVPIAGEALDPRRFVDTDDSDPGDGDDDGVTAWEPAQPTVRKKRSRGRRYRRRALLVVIVVLIPVVFSYVSALLGPGNDSVQARTVEWAREHHLGSVVDRVETYWYAHHQAKIGGTPNASNDQLNLVPGPQQTAAAGPPDSAAGADPVTSTSPAGDGSSVTASPAPAATSGILGGGDVALAPPGAPAALISPAPDPVAGEGQWTGIGPKINGRYGVFGTLIRPDAIHTSVLDAVVWMDPTRVDFRAYPGVKIPGAPWDRPDSIEVQRQASLIAAFNGGFRLADSRGGMFLGGTVLQPLKTGVATFVIDRNGVPSVGMWGRDFTSTDHLDSARQNLDLIVDGGVISPKLATDANRAWGFTGPANRDAVWRSGAGVTADGALVWVVGDGLSIVSLANMLIRAGAVRGMQMDINHEWVQFNTYAADASGVVHGRKLLAAMEHSNNRYLTEDTRDFIAIFARSN